MSIQTISRRSAFTGLALSVVGGAAGFAYGRNSSINKHKDDSTGANSYGPAPAPASAPAGGGTVLAKVDQIPKDGGVILADKKVVLTRGADGTVHGFSAVCTHQACTVNAISNGVISCPCHGSKYDVATGAVVGGPAPSPLPKVPIVVRGNDILAS